MVQMRRIWSCNVNELFVDSDVQQESSVTSWLTTTPPLLNPRIVVVGQEDDHDSEGC
jgi:hypothetical protein